MKSSLYILWQSLFQLERKSGWCKKPLGSCHKFYDGYFYLYVCKRTMVRHNQTKAQK
jgi:hypothetical protein